MKQFFMYDFKGSVYLSFLPIPFLIRVYITRKIDIFPYFRLKPCTVRMDTNDPTFTKERFWHKYREVNWLCFNLQFGLISKTNY